MDEASCVALIRGLGKRQPQHHGEVYCYDPRGYVTCPPHFSPISIWLTHTCVSLTRAHDTSRKLAYQLT